MPSPVQTPSEFSQLQLTCDVALTKYEETTGKSILSHPLAAELRRCGSVDATLAILQVQAEPFEPFAAAGDRGLVERIAPSVHVLDTLSGTLDEGSLVSNSCRLRSAL